MQIEEFPSEKAVLHFTFLRYNYDSHRGSLDLLRKKKQPLCSGSWFGTQGSILCLLGASSTLLEWMCWLRQDGPGARPWVGHVGDAPGSTVAKGDNCGTSIHNCPEHLTVQPEGPFMLQGQVPPCLVSEKQGWAEVQSPILSYQQVPSSSVGDVGEGGSSPFLRKLGEMLIGHPQGTSFCE